MHAKTSSRMVTKQQPIYLCEWINIFPLFLNSIIKYRTLYILVIIEYAPRIFLWKNRFLLIYDKIVEIHT